MAVLLPVFVGQTFLSVSSSSEVEPATTTAIDPDEFVNGEVCRQASPFPDLGGVPGRFAGWFHSVTTGTLPALQTSVLWRHACGGFCGVRDVLLVRLSFWDCSI